MTISQREKLSNILSQLGYPILSSHVITSEDTICNSYVNVAKISAESKKRFDLLADLYFHKL